MICADGLPVAGTPYHHIGDVFEIKGLAGKWQRVPGRYDYKAAPTTCPVCKEVAAGVPWGGWFSCDNRCNVVCLLSTGEVYQRCAPENGETPPHQTPLDSQQSGAARQGGRE